MGEEISYEIVERQQASSLQNRVQHFTSKVLLKGGIRTLESGLLVDIIEKFYEAVTELYNELVLSVAKSDDRAQLILATDTMNHPISTPVRKASDLTADHISVAVSKAQNSGVKVSIQFIYACHNRPYMNANCTGVLG